MVHKTPMTMNSAPSQNLGRNRSLKTQWLPIGTNKYATAAIETSCDSCRVRNAIIASKTEQSSNTAPIPSVETDLSIDPLVEAALMKSCEILLLSTADRQKPSSAPVIKFRLRRH